jgi:hypothetical protein
MLLEQMLLEQMFLEQILLEQMLLEQMFLEQIIIEQMLLEQLGSFFKNKLALADNFSRSKNQMHFRGLATFDQAAFLMLF